MEEGGGSVGSGSECGEASNGSGMRVWDEEQEKTSAWEASRWRRGGGE